MMPAWLDSADLSRQSRWELFSRSSGKHSEQEFWAVEVEQRKEVEEGALIWAEEDGQSRHSSYQLSDTSDCLTVSTL